MSFRNLAKILVIGLIIFLSWTNIVQAGFGVTPPGVTNYNLLPGSHFEETIYLVQGKPEKDLLATIEVDAPEIKSWISIDQGFEFTIPAGSQQFPIKIIIDVPQKAEFKNYSGKLWVKTAPVTKEGGMVSIALGAIITLDLRISAEKIYGFAFRGMTIKDTEEGRSIKVLVTLQNVGNTIAAPSKIHLDVYDVYLQKVLQTSDVTKIDTIKPFETKSISVKFPNKLAQDSYFGAITIYKDDKVIGEAKQAFKVLERTGIFYKIFSKWYTWVVVIVLILIAFAIKQKRELREFLRRRATKRLEKKKSKIEKKLRKLTGV